MGRGCVQCGDTGADSHQGWRARNYTSLLSTTSKTYELFISAIFHLIFSPCSLAQVTETSENKIADTGELLYLSSLNLYEFSHRREKDLERCSGVVVVQAAGGPYRQ